MTDRHEKPRKPGPAAERAERERRLAQALRDNLRRRKEQARAKAESCGESGPGEDNSAKGKRSG